MRITSLHRYPVKGLSPGPIPLSSVVLTPSDGTFPDDRRYALLEQGQRSTSTSFDRKLLFDPNDPEWLHKENFVCAFTEPELLSTLEAEYRVVGCPWDDSHCVPVDVPLSRGDDGEVEKDEEGGETDAKVRRMLTLYRRSGAAAAAAAKVETTSQPPQPEPLVGPVDLSSASGRAELSTFFTDLVGRDVVCVTASSSPEKKKNGDRINNHNPNHHRHQFGNTSSGVKNNDGDTRTIHIVNAATVEELSKKIGIPLNPLRFRPNVVVDGLKPWEEFDLVGKTLRVIDRRGAVEDGTMTRTTPPSLQFDVVSRTVRCAGVGIDPLDPSTGILDIPKLLMEHYPEHGPFLGVYAVIRPGGAGGTLSVGDTLEVLV